MAKISELATAIGQARLNPSLVQDQVYTAMEQATDGTLDLVDPSTPFSLLLGAGTALYVASIEDADVAVRQQYPQLAQTYNDLYYHMSSVDYLDRFSTPANATFFYVLSMAELKQRLLPVGDTGVKQLIVPRNTAWTINTLTFTSLYPVVIKQQPHGGIEVTFDTTSPSPLLSLESNIANTTQWTNTQTGTTYLIIEVPTLQVKITSDSVAVTAGSTFVQNYTLTDTYCYCRVWGKQSDGSWVEYDTTHSADTFDANTVTIVLAVTEKTLSVNIPQIYITNKLIASEIRVDIYTTVGALKIDLGAYTPTNYSVSYIDNEDPDTTNAYSAPLQAFNDVYYYSSDLVNGGANGLSFEALRERVIHNANYTNTPITERQLTTTLVRNGFTLLKSTDDALSRTFLATRAMPTPTSGKFTTGLGSSMELFQTSLAALVGYSSVADNGTRVTIKPTTCYTLANGALRIVGDSELALLKAMDPEERITAINNGQYVFSPFHYVLDTANDNFVTRPYYLENPRVTGRTFIYENPTVQLDVAPNAYHVEKTETGYTLTVTETSGQSWKDIPNDQVHLLLAFQPEGDTALAWLPGTLLPNTVNGERVWQFTIATTWDITSAHSLVVSNFKLFNTADRLLNMPLSGKWELFFCVDNYTTAGIETSELDTLLPSYLLPTSTYGVSRHRFTGVFGDALTHLWTRSRPVPGSTQYAVWDSDVLAYYTEDVPVTVGGVPQYSVVDGKVVYQWLHRKGDPVIDPNTGLQKVLHVAGTAKLDADGNPIAVLTRQLELQFDLFMFDGAYYFATDTEDTDYVIEAATTITSWINTTVAKLAGQLFENTYLLFYPRRTLGTTRVIINDGREIAIPAGITFHVTYLMPLVSYTNLSLRSVLESSAITIINNVLSNATVSTSDIISQLRAAAGTDVVGIKVDDFGPNNNISTYTAVDDSNRCMIKRKLALLPSGVLTVEQDIQFDYVNHSLQQIDQA